MDLLTMSGIRKAFSGVPVLNGVELHVAPGEIHALLGENGAGKSTLMNILTGSYTADAGRVTFDGSDITGASIKATEKAGIAFVHQELNLFNDLTAYENIFLGQEETGPLFSLKKKSMIDKAQALFERLGVDIDPTALVGDLKQSQKQLLEISRALFFDAKLLILASRPRRSTPPRSTTSSRSCAACATRVPRSYSSPTRCRRSSSSATPTPCCATDPSWERERSPRPPRAR